MIKVEYYIDNDDLSDEEFENQEPKEFIITKDMIIDLLYDHVKMNKGDTIHEIDIIRQ